MTQGDRPAEPLWEDTAARAAEGDREAGGRPVKVVFTCERHAAQGARGYLREDRPNLVVIPLTCIAMAHPDLAEKALAAGATQVHFVGCPPEDCVNREGNVFMQQRLERKRLPRAVREFGSAGLVSDWLPPDDFRRALAAKTHQTAATAYALTVSIDNWRRLLPVGALLAAVMVATVLLSRVPYAASAGDQARIEIFLGHRGGSPVVGNEAGAGAPSTPAPAGAAGPVRVLLEVDGRSVFDKHYPLSAQGSVQTFAPVAVAPGQRQLRLSLADPALGAQPIILLDQAVTLASRQIVPLQINDAHRGGDPAAGEKLLNETRGGTGTGCRICHSLQPGVKLVGPSLAGIGTQAATRVPYLSAEAYLRQSLTEPDAFVVEGYRRGQMPPDYLARLNLDQLEDLVAYLLTLR
jgi:hypothetical protein